MATNVTAFGNTPQASDDLFLSTVTGLTEDSTNIVWLSVMLNDSGGAARTLYSLDNGLSDGTTLRPVDLLAQDTARTEALSTDTSLGGARIWITADGRVGYDAGTLSTAFVQQLQSLNAGEFLNDSFTYAIRLGNGTLSWATATIQFAGANDAPVVTGAVIGNAVEDGTALTLDALSNASDPDAGAVLSVVDVPAELPPGVSYDAATHSFSIDPSHEAYQSLPAGVVLPVTVVYGVSDGTVTTPASVTFSVTGVNDAAVIGEPTVSEVTEDAGVTGGSLEASGVLAISDVDTGEAAFQTTVAGDAGNLGNLTLAADGSYTYAVDNAAVQFLGAGETEVDSFTVTSVDGTTKEVSFTVRGVNDAAVIGDPTDSSVTEDADVVAGDLTATGTIAISDADQNQSTFKTDVLAGVGALGTLAIAADGGYTYSVANADVQFLGATDTQTDTFTVESFDGTTKQVSFMVQGTNDAAVIGDPTDASVTEDLDVLAGDLTATGTLAISDADQNQSTFKTDVVTGVGALGTLAIAVDGGYTYSVANADVQFLGASDTQTDTFTVESFDGTTKEVSFTVQGANDAAVIGDPTDASVTEDADVVAGDLTATGSIAISDADQNQSSFQTTVTPAAGALGTLALAADGQYTYTVANTQVQFLGASETRVDTFTVSAFDDTTKEVSFTVQGANDVAVIGDPTDASVTEDADVLGGNLTATGSIAISDADQNQSTFKTDVVAGAGALGTLALAADGSYTYLVANADVQFLGASDTQTDTFTIESFDGTTKEVSFTVHGANDAAVIGDPTDASVTEDADVVAGNLTATGTLAISDADQNQSSFQTTVTPAAGALGTLVLAADGNYTYTVANANVQFLGGADSHVDTFTVTALDGTTREVSFTVLGTNDAAAIGAPPVDTVTEDVAVDSGNLSASGMLPITDADQDEAAFQTTVTAAAGAAGSLVLASDGDYTYSVANASVQSLGAEDSLVDTFTVTAVDGTTQEVSFTIQGTNDVAVISGASSASVQEDTGVVGGMLATGGLLAVADADAGQSLFQPQGATAGTYGTFTLAADGTWTYSVSNSLAAVQGLNTGQSLEDGFTALSLDGSASQAVTVTIQGQNDGTGTTGNDTYSFAAGGAGSQTLNDPGGNDLIQITGNNAALSTLNFEKVGNDLQIQVNNQSINVLNHFGGNAIEQITFASGQSYAGYSLSGATFRIYSGGAFGGVNGNSADVVAGTSGAETLDGGGAGSSSGRDLLFGNSGADTLVGRADSDLLVAGGGNDTLQGGDGNDVLVGGADADTFLFNTGLSAANNVDRVADFQAGATDTVMLSKSVFGGLATAGSAGGTALQAGEFFSGANAGTASVGAGVHVLYDTATGNLYYDADGGGAGQRTLFATLDPAGLSGTVDAADFKVGL